MGDPNKQDLSQFLVGLLFLSLEYISSLQYLQCRENVLFNCVGYGVWGMPYRGFVKPSLTLSHISDFDLSASKDQYFSGAT